MNKKLESKYQSELIKKLQKAFPGCIVIKNNPNYIQGIPDLIVLYKQHWVALEVKRSEDSSRRPNQDYYIGKMNDMSFASFVFPENEKEVFDAVQKTFGKVS